MQTEKKVAKRRGLGRGLDALLGPAADHQEAADKRGELRHLPLDTLQRGKHQPRHDFNSESLKELADSIRAQGVVQPILVRPLSGGGKSGYEIVVGERRWRAAQMAGLESIPAVIRDVADDTAVAVALIENIQREDLNSIDQARGLKRLIEEFGMTHTQAAEAVGRSRASVTNILRLLELPEAVRAMLEKRELEMGHARALLGLVTPATITEAARKVASRGLSVRETERLVKKLSATGERKPVPIVVRDPDIERLENELTDKLAARVSLQHTTSGSGRLVIAYGSLDELEGILSHIK